MSMIDQNSALKSLEEALIPSPLLIDGRTEQDMLYFLTEFASLINFYDNTNTVNGNWAPFLLKDPVFLLAAISKTNFNKYQAQYLDISNKLQQCYGSDARSKAVVPALINQLFDLLTGIFMKIERWTYYMQNSAPQYSLKKYVLEQVKTNFSIYFWAIIALREKLYQQSPINGIEPVKYYLFDKFDKITWGQNKDKYPYWQVLGPDDQEEEIKQNLLLDLWGVFNALTKAGNALFGFFYTIINQSTTAFENFKLTKSSFPDTTLLRTFVSLLKNHQEQLNSVSQKHLNFYYQDILKQDIKPAMPDSVFVYATLTKPDATFKLPAGTLLNGGVDDQKNPILFATQADVELNPARISSAYTLTKVVKGNLASLYLQTVATPSTIQQDVNGNTLSWDTFGSSTVSASSLTNLGIAFASPMLLLREGSRKITLTLNFTTAVDLQMLAIASYYLSTATAWLKVTGIVQEGKTAVSATISQAIIEIDLDANQPAIEPFLINPDGLISSWPMLKIEFAAFSSVAIVPVVSSLKIDVNVLNVKTFQLYNDYGALSTKTPYLLFGPVPLVNSGFIIGNNEIFSKPVNALAIEFNWNNLPDDFANYYTAYNNYINPPQPPAAPEPEPKSFINKVLDIIKDKPETPPAPVTVPVPYTGPPVFGNCSFGVNFKILEPKGWSNLKVSTQMNCAIQNCSIKECIYKQQVQSPLSGDPPLPSTLFSTSCIRVAPDSTDAIVHTLNDTSFFSFDKNGIIPYDPTIQLTPLKFEETSTAGFMKMAVATPAYGFGSELYPKIVAEIATANALKVYEIAMDKDADDQKKKTAEIIPPANLPFAPIVNDLVSHYSASVTYDFTNQNSTYPIQCFLYSPFQNEIVYDSTATNKQISTLSGGIPLFSAIDYGGCLFLGLDNLVPANSISLYFEFSRKYGAICTDKQVNYTYLNKNGWNELNVLSDSTNGLTCSGIIKLNVPEDSTNENIAMPHKHYWFAIKVNEPAAYADTIFVTTNGVVAKRVGDTFSAATEAPHIISNTITKLQNVVVQVATVVQPFPSFGGKPAEVLTGMNQRVSSRLKTKDRAVSAEDYFRLIRQEYPEVYYSKTIYNSCTKTTHVYVVKGSKTGTEQDAYMPMITECKEELINTFLNDRASAFARVLVSNFNFLFITITANISIDSGYEPKGLKKSINDALNIYLSPWIKDNGAQLDIDQGITDTIVARFLKTIPGVAGVKSVLFQTATNMADLVNAPFQNTVIPATNDLLIVSGMDHQIITTP